LKRAVVVSDFMIIVIYYVGRLFFMHFSEGYHHTLGDGVDVGSPPLSTFSIVGRLRTLIDDCYLIC
jgi:hypothetical protein